jgi:hypothetical protein
VASLIERKTWDAQQDGLGMEPERRKLNGTTHRTAGGDFAHRNRLVLVNLNTNLKSEADEPGRAGISDAK